MDISIYLQLMHSSFAYGVVLFVMSILCNLSSFCRIRVMVFYATINNISATSWWSVLLVDENGVPRKNHWPACFCMCNSFI